MILLDTSGILAAIDSSQTLHDAARDALRTAGGPRILSPFVLAELDYLVSTRVGQGAAVSFLREVSRGAYQLPSFAPADVAESIVIVEQYSALKIGLTDASIVVLAGRYRCNTILTLDQRHFRAIVGPRNSPFHLLPLDL